MFGLMSSTAQTACVNEIYYNQDLACLEIPIRIPGVGVVRELLQVAGLIPTRPQPAHTIHLSLNNPCL